MKNKLPVLIILMVLIGAVLITLLLINRGRATGEKPTFNADRAYQDVTAQIELGPRTPGSDSQKDFIEYVSSQLKESGWKVEIQSTEKMGHPIKNVIARRGTGSEWVILAAHYDSRLLADEDTDPILAAQPVPGANDGASGVAVLLELARVLPKNLDKEIWLVFFDAEDQGHIPGWDWILGSRAFVESLDGKPDAVVLIDMIGDADLNVYREIASDDALTDEIWQVATDLGYSDSIIDEEKYYILDDHIPFIDAGIPAIDIIDIDYAYYHTSEDTPDKVSPDSLEIIGKTLLTWLEKE